ncbi:MAG: LON peptidase substrate-binding domain-containing protein [Acidimicrobiia bacterium]|jgi:Lon protease-like protein|nr:LON peptidase substrate-binding domain-containing protein [Acidimicrobiia bacterium]MBA3983266.1 LON peptidase substrate-binding domain-containing protein [Acidimicrobiia bacterium]MDQ3391079.1 LON peptidase substrate-binding domain-containing protein [Actinomycetota bacterium]
MVEPPRSLDGLAMFPLGQVLLPTTVMELHVFEPRYRQLVIDCLGADRDPPQFGTVLIERGSEVGGGDQRASTGVMAEMRQVQALDGGRYALLAVGMRRIRVVDWLHDDPYPRARFEEWEDPDIADPTLTETLAATRRHAEIVRELMQGTGREPALDQLVSDEAPEVAAYQIAAQLPIGPSDRLGLLTAPTIKERFARLDRALDDLESVLRFGLT